jgi:nitroimidazol reductase NimA-like FMN-containing flavoprotein (pyridoxamine 5'-phosphate oxidase superfamily)
VSGGDLFRWPSLHLGGRVEVLEPGECRRLLEGSRLGRLGYLTATGPRIVPLNYTVVGGALAFLTGASGEPGRCARSAPVAFEVDQVDEFLQTGWSVLVTGHAEELTAAMYQALDLAHTPDPWPGGDKSLLLSLPLEAITGRRVHLA